MFKRDDLLEIGIALADVYVILDKFSSNRNTATARAEQLKSFLASSRSKQGYTTHSYPKKRSKASSLTVTFTWHNYDNKKKKYAQVREQMGGGRRQQIMQRSSTFETILENAKGLFFPRGKNSKKKRLTDFSYFVGDFALNQLSSELEISLESETKLVKFTLDEYMRNNALKQARFIFMTKERRWNELYLCKSDSDDSDLELPSAASMFFQSSTPTYPNLSTPTYPNFVHDLGEKEESENVNVLQVRRDLVQQQDEAFRLSLEADQEKEKVFILKPK